MDNKNFFKITLFVVFSCITLIWVFDNYLTTQKQEKIEIRIDSYLKELTDLVDKNKNLVMTASVLLSKDESIKRCLRTKEQCNCLKYLSKSKESLLNTYLFDDFKIHVHDKDLNSFYRLWDPNRENDSLDSFRHSLKIVKKHKTPISCIEIGRFSMLIRGISPVIDDGKYLGSIEAITNFNSLIEEFEQKGVKLYILMNREYQSVASKVEFSKEQELRDFVLLNKTNEDISFLNDVDFNGTQYHKMGYYYIVNTPIYDISRQVIGYYVLKVYL